MGNGLAAMRGWYWWKLGWFWELIRYVFENRLKVKVVFRGVDGRFPGRDRGESLATSSYVDSGPIWL